jgi:methylase of polypeptide subunit release factors
VKGNGLALELNSNGYMELTELDTVRKTDWKRVPTSEFWSSTAENELRRHKIHAYPAKFPAFIPTKAMDVAENAGLSVQRVADVFCGCGTVAFEARRGGYDFWGCDLNPVATLIAKTKSSRFRHEQIDAYQTKILLKFDKLKSGISIKGIASDRIDYWYFPEQRKDLARLALAIQKAVPARSPYRYYFRCAFSNILKSTSRWLTKSIKPQVDPKKKPSAVRPAFLQQVKFMRLAFEDCAVPAGSHSTIVTGNVLHCELPSNVDLIITSPPYVTSYEYADLHQLSSLWLGFAEDYRTLRDGSIGSSQHTLNFDREIKRLNETGARVVFSLFDQDRSLARSVANYYLDMQKVAQKCRQMLSSEGMALFVIGDTEYKGVRIENARHLSESLIDAGFRTVRVTKRLVKGKILTPYRTEKGRFTRSSLGRNVYAEEFVLIATK